MEWTYDNIKQWFDVYFEDVGKYQGDLETVPNLRRYFSEDLELVLYTGPSSPPAMRMSRDELLISFVHPGLQEGIIPHYYAIDPKQMIVAVHFEIRFEDKPSKKTWQPLQASAHYHVTVDDHKDLKIRKIHYWTEALPEDLFDVWAKRREEALNRHALNVINSKS